MQGFDIPFGLLAMFSVDLRNGVEIQGKGSRVGLSKVPLLVGPLGESGQVLGSQCMDRIKLGLGQAICVRMLKDSVERHFAVSIRAY